MAATAQPPLAAPNRDEQPRQSWNDMNHQKIEGPGCPRTPDSVSPRLFTLGHPHHFPTEAGTTESLFDYGDRIALLQHRIGGGSSPRSGEVPPLAAGMGRRRRGCDQQSSSVRCYFRDVVTPATPLPNRWGEGWLGVRR